MRPIAVALVLSAFILLGCQSQSYQTMGVHLTGHSFRSIPGCVRTKPVDNFDAKCDYPRIGYRDFSNPTGDLSDAVREWARALGGDTSNSSALIRVICLPSKPCSWAPRAFDVVSQTSCPGMNGPISSRFRVSGMQNIAFGPEDRSYRQQSDNPPLAQSARGECCQALSKSNSEGMLVPRA